jgi:hypothetical protein
MEREVGAKVVNGEIIVIDGINNETITIKARKNIIYSSMEINVITTKHMK